MVNPMLYQIIAGALDEILTNEIGEKVGFCLLIFPFGDAPEGRGAEYVSNGKREDMIKFLRATATCLENNEDFPAIIGEA